MVTARLGTGFAAIALVACAARSMPGSAVPCDAPARGRWATSAQPSPRVLAVWMDERAQRQDGWSTYGRRRLRTAIERWNAIRLPVRLDLATGARGANVVVNVVDTLPSDLGTRVTTQGGVTRLEFGPAGDITKAHVFIAVRARFGVQYLLAEQEAMLVHELGHALGLPHATGSKSLMSELRSGGTLTGTDIALARSIYPAASCGSSSGGVIQSSTPQLETLPHGRVLVTRWLPAGTVTRERYSLELQWANVTLYTTETSQRQNPSGRLNRDEFRLHPIATGMRPDGRGFGAGGMFGGGPYGFDRHVVRTAYAATMGRGG